MKRRWWFYLRKTVVLLVIGAVLTAGLMAFNVNRRVLMNQHPYYLPMYAAVARYDLESLADIFRPATSRASAPVARAAAVPVLVYHGIRPKPEGENISIANFADQMLALKRAGWQAIGIQDYHDFMRRGKPLPAKSMMITFDDGRRDSYYTTDPLLAALGYRATMFVITRSSFAAVENKFYLNRTELAAMRDSGHWDLQPHAAFGHYLYPINEKGQPGHFYDNKLWIANQARLEIDQEFATRTMNDLRLAKTELAREIGSSGIAFAFPYNEFGHGTVNYEGAQDALMANVGAIFPIAFYQIWPNKGNSQNYPQDSSFLMKRILVDSKIDSGKLLKLLDSSSAKPLPYVNAMTEASGDWVNTWGEHHWGPRGLAMRAEPDGTGAALFLDGGGGWHNYAATGHFRLQRGQWGRLLGRLRDDRNYVSCQFSSTGVLVEQTLNGTVHTLKQVDMAVPVHDFQAGLTVNGSRADCMIDGQTAAYSERLAPELQYGGIGFSSYDPNPNNSELEISEVRVEPLP